MDGEGFCPTVEQLEENESLVRRDFIGIVDDEDVVGPGVDQSRHAVVSQESAQVVISDPAVLTAALWEMVQEHIQDLVPYVVVGTIEEELQEPGTGKVFDKDFIQI